MKFDRAVAVYIIGNNGQVLLLKHKKLNAWLPPGGHVEDDELVHEAAEREVMEETGVPIEFVSYPNDLGRISDNRVKSLPRPFLVQLEDMGDHYHEDFVYIAKAKSYRIINRENHDIKWFSLEEAVKLDTFENVRKQLEFLKSMPYINV